MIRFDTNELNSGLTLGTKKSVRWPGIEPGSNAWKASMLTITPPTLVSQRLNIKLITLSGRTWEFYDQILLRHSLVIVPYR